MKPSTSTSKCKCMCHIAVKQYGMLDCCADTENPSSTKGNKKICKYCGADGIAPCIKFIPHTPTPEAGWEENQKLRKKLMDIAYRNRNGVPIDWIEEVEQFIAQLLAEEYKRGARNQVMLDADTLQEQREEIVKLIEEVEK